MENSSNAAELERSYDRNLGYARFWLGVGIAILSLLFTFGYARIFGDDGSSAAQSAADQTPDITALLALLALFLIAAICFGLGFVFRVLYRRDNAALTHIQRPQQEATS